MARQELPKEDLVRDAKAFAVRVEFRREEDEVDWIFVGLRTDGGGSVYFGEAEFYAFNSQGELRRAFVDDRLLKAEIGRLIAMRRERSEGESVLAASTLPPEEQERLLHRIETRLRGTTAAIEAGAFLAIRTGGERASDLSKVRDWLSTIAASEVVVAQRPNAE